MNFDDASKALVELAASRHDAFHTSEAAGISVNTQRLRRCHARGELILLQPKVWAMAALPASDAQRLRAATLSIGGSAASLMSAAWLHGWLDSPPALPQVWHGGGVGKRRTRVSTHKCERVDPDHDVTEVNHIRTLNKAAALCLLGTVAAPLVVEKCLDEFLRTESEAWLDKTMNRLQSNLCPGFRRLVEVRNSPHRVAGVADSWLERTVAKLTNLDWMPPLVLQHPVAVEGRTFN